MLVRYGEPAQPAVGDRRGSRLHRRRRARVHLPAEARRHPRRDRPALYAYVDDKRDLLRGVAELEFRRLSARFEEIDDAIPSSACGG